MGTDNLSVMVKKKSRFYSSLSETSHLTTQCTQFSIITKHKKTLLKKLKIETEMESLNRQLSFEHKVIKELHSKKAQRQKVSQQISTKYLMSDTSTALLITSEQ